MRMMLIFLFGLVIFASCTFAMKVISPYPIIGTGVFEANISYTNGTGLDLEDYEFSVSENYFNNKYVQLVNEANLNVNSSNYWDDYDTPANIGTSELNNDAGFVTSNCNSSGACSDGDVVYMGYANQGDFQINGTSYFATYTDGVGDVTPVVIINYNEGADDNTQFGIGNSSSYLLGGYSETYDSGYFTMYPEVTNFITLDSSGNVIINWTSGATVSRDTLSVYGGGWFDGDVNVTGLYYGNGSQLTDIPNCNSTGSCSPNVAYMDYSNSGYLEFDGILNRTGSKDDINWLNGPLELISTADSPRSPITVVRDESGWADVMWSIMRMRVEATHRDVGDGFGGSYAFTIKDSDGNENSLAVFGASFDGNIDAGGTENTGKFQLDLYRDGSKLTGLFTMDSHGNIGIHDLIDGGIWFDGFSDEWKLGLDATEFKLSHSGTFGTNDYLVVDNDTFNFYKPININNNVSIDGSLDMNNNNISMGSGALKQAQVSHWLFDFGGGAGEYVDLSAFEYQFMSSGVPMFSIGVGPTNPGDITSIGEFNFTGSGTNQISGDLLVLGNITGEDYWCNATDCYTLQDFLNQSSLIDTTIGNCSDTGSCAPTIPYMNYTNTFNITNGGESSFAVNSTIGFNETETYASGIRSIITSERGLNGDQEISAFTADVNGHVDDNEDTYYLGFDAGYFNNNGGPAEGAAYLSGSGWTNAFESEGGDFYFIDYSPKIWVDNDETGGDYNMTFAAAGDGEIVLESNTRLPILTNSYMLLGNFSGEDVIYGTQIFNDDGEEANFAILDTNQTAMAGTKDVGIYAYDADDPQILVNENNVTINANIDMNDNNITNVEHLFVHNISGYSEIGVQSDVNIIGDLKAGSNGGDIIDFFNGMFTFNNSDNTATLSNLAVVNTVDFFNGKFVFNDTDSTLRTSNSGIILNASDGSITTNEGITVGGSTISNFGNIVGVDANLSDITAANVYAEEDISLTGNVDNFLSISTTNLNSGNASVAEFALSNDVDEGFDMFITSSTFEPFPGFNFPNFAVISTDVSGGFNLESEASDISFTTWEADDDILTLGNLESTFEGDVKINNGFLNISNPGDIYYDGALVPYSPHVFDIDTDVGYTRTCWKDEEGYWNLVWFKGGVQQVEANSKVCNDKINEINLKRDCQSQDKVYDKKSGKCLSKLKKTISWSVIE